MFSEYDKYMVM